jgi:hypothetical protein
VQLLCEARQSRAQATVVASAFQSCASEEHSHRPRRLSTDGGMTSTFPNHFLETSLMISSRLPLGSSKQKQKQNFCARLWNQDSEIIQLRQVGVTCQANLIGNWALCLITQSVMTTSHNGNFRSQSHGSSVVLFCSRTAADRGVKLLSVTSNFAQAAFGEIPGRNAGCPDWGLSCLSPVPPACL